MGDTDWVDRKVERQSRAIERAASMYEDLTYRHNRALIKLAKLRALAMNKDYSNPAGYLSISARLAVLAILEEE